MSTGTPPLPFCLHDPHNALATLARFHAEVLKQGDACPCYPMLQLVGMLHAYLLSLREAQCHTMHSNVTSGCTMNDYSGLNMLNVTMGTADASFLASDAVSPSFCNETSPIEPDAIYHPLPNAPLNTETEFYSSYLSEPDLMQDYNFDLEPPLVDESVCPDLGMTACAGHVSSQMWSPQALPQSSDEGLACDHRWATEETYNSFDEPLSHDIHPHTQDSSNALSSLFDAALPSPALMRSEGSPSRGNESLSWWDDPGGPVCRWDRSCSSILTVEKSEVAKHLHIAHGVKPGGDKNVMSCSWDGCGKEMKKESISRHIVAVHLSKKTECTSCGKQFARWDSKLRHLKNSKREECRESEIHDSRVKRRRLSWP